MSYLEIAKQAMAAKSRSQQGRQEAATDVNAQAREELDRFFIKEMLPLLCKLYVAGKLPNLSEDPQWAEIEAEWRKAASDSPVVCDAALVKRMMFEAVERWESPDQPDLYRSKEGR